MDWGSRAIPITFVAIPVADRSGIDAELDGSFATRRLCQVKVVNIPGALTLHELVPSGRPDWGYLKQSYEKALDHFEGKDFRSAARLLGEVVTQPVYREDGPSLVLLQRAVTGIVEEHLEFDPVWELSGK